MKENIDYYQHSANAHEHAKFKMLRVKYGWEGEGKFWALNNKIATAKNCMLNISKEYNRATIAVDLDFTLEELDEFLEYIEKKCNLIIKNDNAITTEKIQEAYSRVYGKRKRNADDYRRRQNPEDDFQDNEKPVDLVSEDIMLTDCEQILKKHEELSRWWRYLNKEIGRKCKLEYQYKTLKEWELFFDLVGKEKAAEFFTSKMNIIVANATAKKALSKYSYEYFGQAIHREIEDFKNEWYKENG